MNQQEKSGCPLDDTAQAYSTFTKLMDVSKFFRSYCYKSVTDLGFTLNEIDVLMSLKQHPEKNTVKGISETAHLSKGVISQAVESLRQKAFVTVNADQKDRRLVLISLSAMAAPVLERLKEASTAFVEKILNGISIEQLQELYGTVMQVYMNKENMRAQNTAGAEI